MGLFSIKDIAITAIHACVPARVIDNMDYEQIPESERKLFISTTGVAERRVASDNVCTSDMCYVAAVDLLEQSKTQKEEIDILVFVSQSPDYFLPATSIVLQDRLGLSKNTLAFDINLGCSGYVYGLSVISSLLSTTHFNKALLLVGDKSSLSISEKDKSAYPLFGDAGTATLLEKSAGETIFFNLQSDGSGKESIIIRGGATRHPYSEETRKMKKFEEGIERTMCQLELNGMEVFNFSLKEVKPNLVQLLQYANSSVDAVNFFIFHQANKLMNESIRKKTGIPVEKCPYSIAKYGNTSSASIPLTMVSELGDELKNRNLTLALSGFGVGLSWGSVLLKTTKLKSTGLMEIE